MASRDAENDLGLWFFLHQTMNLLLELSLVWDTMNELAVYITSAPVCTDGSD